MTHLTPCTVSFLAPTRVRGGKGFEARYQARLALEAAHAAAYCARCDDTTVRLSTMGATRGRYSVATGTGEAAAYASRCAETGYGAHTIAYSNRFICRTDIVWTVC